MNTSLDTFANNAKTSSTPKPSPYVKNWPNSVKNARGNEKSPSKAKVNGNQVLWTVSNALRRLAL